MKVTREESAARREQIVEIASELFRKRGFDGVAISDIMKAVGVTHGGFYGHFESKEQLAAEACTRANTRNRWDRYMDGAVHQRLRRIVGGYLSERHRDDPGHGCLLAAVAADVTRQPRSVRDAFTSALRSKVDLLIGLMPGQSGQSAKARRAKSLATLSGLVGTLILARAVNDRELSNEILSAGVTAFAEAAGD